MLAQIRRNVEADGARLSFAMSRQYVGLAAGVKSPSELIGKVSESMHDALHGLHPAFYMTSQDSQQQSRADLARLYREVFYDPDTPEGQKRQREYAERYKQYLKEQESVKVDFSQDERAKAALARLAAARQGR